MGVTRPNAKQMVVQPQWPPVTAYVRRGGMPFCRSDLRRDVKWILVVTHMPAQQQQIPQKHQKRCFGYSNCIWTNYIEISSGQCDWLAYWAKMLFIYAEYYTQWKGSHLNQYQAGSLEKTPDCLKACRLLEAMLQSWQAMPCYARGVWHFCLEWGRSHRTAWLNNSKSVCSTMFPICLPLHAVST